MNYILDFTPDDVLYPTALHFNATDYEFWVMLENKDPVITIL